MKLRSLLFLLGFIASGAHAQTFPSSCIPQGNIGLIYKQDAYRLSLKRVNDINATWKDSVEIPAIFVDSIAKALYAIDNMQWSSLKDTIRTLFGYSDFVNNSNFEGDSIHIYHAGDFQTYKLKGFSISVATASAWVSDWASGNYSNTSNDTINYLVSRYGLQINGGGSYYYLTMPVNLNIIALMHQFAAVQGVVATYADGYIGDGNYIITETEQGNVVLTFDYACGDCPAGCTYGRRWKFSVSSADCSVTLISAQDYGGIYIGLPLFGCLGQILPVSFTAFAGQLVNNKVALKWDVAMETGNEKYIIERSVDGKNFATIGEVKAAGIGINQISYKWVDEQPLDMNYYRIESIGVTGAIQYTQVVKVRSSNSRTFISVYPNPVIGKSLTIQFYKPANSTYFLKILSTTGQVVYTKQLQVSANEPVKEIRLSNTILPGTYLMNISGKNEKAIKTLVIQ